MELLLRYFALYKAAKAIVDFCYGGKGEWIGTENIRSSVAFMALMHELYRIIYPWGRV